MDSLSPHLRFNPQELQRVNPNRIPLEQAWPPTLWCLWGKPRGLSALCLLVTPLDLATGEQSLLTAVSAGRSDKKGVFPERIISRVCIRGTGLAGAQALGNY